MRMPTPTCFRLLILFLLCCCAGCELLHEEPDEESDDVFSIVDEMPRMIPSDTEGMKTLQQCIVYPEAAKEAGVEGRVVVQFIVNKRGEVEEPVVQHGLGYGIDEGVVRCIRQIQFTPGHQDGKPVKVKMSIPVTFRLR